MKLKLLFLLFLASFSSFAQYTFIPDVKFENRLIYLKIDSGTADGKVLTANVSSVTSLNLSGGSITDLNGIQDFVALQTLYCDNNQLTSLDVSKNTALTELRCYSNSLTNLDVSQSTALTGLSCQDNRLPSLDVSKNIALTRLDCSGNILTALDVSNNTVLKYLTCDRNQFANLDVSKNTALADLVCGATFLTALDVSKNTALGFLSCPSTKLTALDISKNTALKYLNCLLNKLTSLDVSKNTALTTLYCSNTQLTSLDVSKNVALTSLGCESNQLTSLNLKNGNNVNLSTRHFNGNPNLSCIQVDNVSYSNIRWASAKDATASYSTSCPTLGTEESIFSTISVYPNPTKGEIHIDNCIVKKATTYDALGKLVKTTIFDRVSANNTINMAGLPSGLYYIYLQSQGDTKVEKIIVE